MVLCRAFDAVILVLNNVAICGFEAASDCSAHKGAIVAVLDDAEANAAWLLRPERLPRIVVPAFADAVLELDTDYARRVALGHAVFDWNRRRQTGLDTFEPLGSCSFGRSPRFVLSETEMLCVHLATAHDSCGDTLGSCVTREVRSLSHCGMLPS